MSSKNIINLIIKDNLKINENQSIINDNKNQNQIDQKKDNDSFQKLLSLQLLIQKYSGLKELCKKKIFYYLKYSY